MPNPVAKFQILAPQPDQAARFYGNLFKWTIDAANALGYRTIITGDGGINGGIWPAPPETPSFVQLFVEVDDIDSYLAKAVAAGASVIIPRSELPDGDSLAILRDPFGLSFGLYRPPPRGG